MTNQVYDIVILGGGAGGLTVAAGAAGLGAKVALIEKSELLGGDCLHYGCVPSKTFISEANRVNEIRKVANILENNQFDNMLNDKLFRNALQCVCKAIEDIQHHDDIDRFRRLGVDVIKGLGRFKNAKEIELDNGKIVKGKKFVIATGSRPNILSLSGLNQIDFLTNETVFSLARRPSSLAVIGGGAIGVELAQAFSCFGTKVTLFEKGLTILNKEDQDIAQLATTILNKEIEILHNSKLVEVQNALNREKVITFQWKGQQIQRSFDELLIATGRKPNTDHIGLENLDIQMDGSYIHVDATMRTSVKHIFAIGDVVRAFPFTHAANNEAKIVVSNALFGMYRKVNYSNTPWVIFTDPEIFHLGYTEQEARSRFGQRIHVYSTSLNEVDRFITENKKEGMLKIITNHRGKILGAHAIGSGAGDWMQEVVYAKTFNKHISSLSIPVYPYPIRAGAVQHVANQYWRNKIFNGWLPTIMKCYFNLFK